MGACNERISSLKWERNCISLPARGPILWDWWRINFTQIGKNKWTNCTLFLLEEHVFQFQLITTLQEHTNTILSWIDKSIPTQCLAYVICLRISSVILYLPPSTVSFPLSSFPSPILNGLDFRRSSDAPLSSLTLLPRSHTPSLPLIPLLHSDNR